MQAFIYCAVSSLEQASTLADQEHDLRALCTTKGWDVAGVFSDVGSAAKGPREHFVRMAEQLLAHPQDAMIVLTRVDDRISRGEEIEGALALIRRLHKAGYRFYSRKDGAEHLDTPMQWAGLGVKLAGGAEDNLLRSDKVSQLWRSTKRNAANYADAALGLHAPYGCELVKKRAGDGTKYLAIVAKEPAADAIRLAFKMRLTGHGTQAIARRLRAISPPTEQRNGESVDPAWDSPAVARMLRREDYVRAGIVSAEDSARVRAISERGKGKGGSTPRKHDPLPLVGALRCECGVAMAQLMMNKGKNAYYRCEDKKHAHGKTLFVRADAIEEQFLWLLRAFKNKPELFEARQSHAEELALVRKARGTLQKRIDANGPKQKRWRDAMSDGKIEADDYAATMRELRSELHQLEADLASANARAAELEALELSADERAAVMRDGLERWERAKPVEKRVLAKIVSGIAGGIHVGWFHHEGALVARELMLTERGQSVRFLFAPVDERWDNGSPSQGGVVVQAVEAPPL